MTSGIVPAEASQSEPVLEVAPPWKRFVAWVLDLVFFVVLLGVGWALTVVLLSVRGQTPGKWIVGIFVVHASGGHLSCRTFILRELVLKYVVGIATFEVSTIVGGIQILWDGRPWWDFACTSRAVQRIPQR
jgi:uncharacterized RDD family membrane protein YckC